MEMEPEDFKDICNKSVPVYVLPTIHCETVRLVAVVLHNYIYRRWFRPYRSELSHFRFICKSLASLNQHICDKVQDLRQEYTERAADYQKNGRSSIWEPTSTTSWTTIVMSSSISSEPCSSLCIEDGLSAPITFAPIADKIENHLGDSGNAVKTTLATAIDFVMGLEAREAAAFGLRPDPAVLARADPQIFRFGKHEIPHIPSTQFVSDKNARKWGRCEGDSKDYDTRIMPHYEQQEFRWFHNRASQNTGTP
ncbi:hypothetical protein B0T25DRAFT_581508 [Lasiosphaeria hispida]|uniref:Uncharacterized protein n=1 Tax=Lasiosphaeria hispida TaxID=260671 RepID=A0AAJ0HK31_9PEZI|nr:hypothetical protein B0T25DRAFT_581508 [Lasiosphaeria hispida]